MKIFPARCTAIFKPYVALEPAYTLFHIGYQLSDFLKTNVYLQKKCRHQMDFEPDLETPCEDERAGVDFAASVNSKTLFIGNLTATALVVLLASRSDKSNGGRKFSILLPIGLRTAQMVSMCLQSYFWHWSVWFSAITEGLCEFGTVMKVASMVYICSISSNEERIFRMTLLNVLDVFVSVITSGSSGFLLRKFGFLNTYILCTIFCSLSLIHLAVFLKEAAIESQHQKQGCIKSLVRFFDLRAVAEGFGLFFKKRKGNERAVVWILSLISILAWSSFAGERSTFYLYLRYKFGWNEEDYGLYYLYKLVGYNVGNIICLGLNKYLKLSDYALVVFTSFWSVLAAVGYIFASLNWHLFLLPLLDIFRYFSVNICDSLQSKFFKSDEFGRMFSVHEALNMAVSLNFPAYNILFQKTLDTAPSAIFILSSSINFCSFLLFCICYLLMRTPSENDEESTGGQEIGGSMQTVNTISSE